METTSQPNDMTRRSLIARFIRWLFSWRTVRWILIGTVGLITLATLFCMAENWRGKRAWDECRRELEAKGEVLDRSAYVPAPVTDDQNFFAAPKMAEWFVRPIQQGGVHSGFSNEFTGRLSIAQLTEMARRNGARGPIKVAELTYMASHDSSPEARSNVVTSIVQPDGRERIANAIRKAVGESAYGCQTFTFLAQSLDEIRPSGILVRSTDSPQQNAMAEFLGADIIPKYVGRLHVEADTDNKSLYVMLTPLPSIAARDYLEWSSQFDADFNRIRDALKRPRAWMEGDYNNPFEIPLVNFVAMRALAQTLAQRAQCHMLLNEPGKALQELTLMHDLNRILEEKPNTLVATMIDVAITGLYAEVIAEGIQVRGWSDADLTELQRQLAQIDLLRLLIQSFRAERAAVCHTFETAFTEVAELSRDASYLPDSTFLFLRGWLYQNITTVARLEQQIIESFDLTNHLVQPAIQRVVGDEVTKTMARWSPYTMLAGIVVPNFSRATQTLARNQTKVNQALIACALERHRLVRGSYPETLDSLVPQFAEKLPHDIIGGQPLKYRRTDDPPSQSSGAASGKFLLYSIGWNETDDGGVVVAKKDGSPDIEQGDWVWGQQAK